VLCGRRLVAVFVGLERAFDTLVFLRAVAAALEGGKSRLARGVFAHIPEHSSGKHVNVRALSLARPGVFHNLTCSPDCERSGRGKQWLHQQRQGAVRNPRGTSE